MAFFEWEDSFSVNVAEIDQQHRRLIALVNELYEAIERSDNLATLESVMKELDTVVSVISELMNYASVHFSTEEKYMIEYEYPAYSEHYDEHRRFVDKVETFRQDFAKEKTRLSIDVAEFIRDWWRSHILGADKACGAFLHNKGLR
jgi:hemerythrin-like metal-binding protein